MNRTEFRSSVLFAYGASLEATRELLDYNANPFQREQVAVPKQLPLTAELHVEAWERYLTQAQHSGAYATLTVPLVQLHFPIRPGISRTDTYRSATLN
ncbi:MAG TPA: hypothetical protein VLG46_01230, partial [Anaerolineae bacterium]|nr:hypothetical protein [Anaerolineae bacterium]